MSLVICSNRQAEYDRKTKNPDDAWTKATGIQNPADFSNHLVNPIKLPPNTEVAVASVKLKRQTAYDVKDDDVFYFQLGTALEDNKADGTFFNNQTTSIPHKVRLKPGVYAPSRFKNALENAIKECLTHPNYFQQCEVHNHYVSGVWSGFEFVFSQHAKDTNTDVRGSLTNFQGYHPDTTRNSANGGTDWTISDAVLAGGGVGGFSIKRIKDHEADPTAPDYGSNVSTQCCVINTDAPMHLQGGEVQWTLAEVGKEGSVSKSRDQRASHFFFTRPYSVEAGGQGPNRFCVPGTKSINDYNMEEDEMFHADYVVSWARQFSNFGGGGFTEKYALCLHQAVWDPDEGTSGGVVMREIEYWLGNPGGDDGATNPVKAQITEDDITDYTNTSNSTGYFLWFKMEFAGSGMKLSMAHHTKGMPALGGNNLPTAFKIICDSTKTANRAVIPSVWTPISQNKEALYMGQSQQYPTGEIKIKKLCSFANKASHNEYQFGKTYKEDNSLLSDAIGSCYWCKSVWRDSIDPYDLENVRRVESRENQQAKAGASVKYIDVNATGDSLEMSRALILNTPIEQKEELGVYFPSPGAKMARYLGFHNFSVVSSSFLGNSFEDDLTTADTDPAFLYKVNSPNIPELLKHSCFIKSPTLTGQSYNFAKSKPSQILYHLPKFDNTNADDGELYFICPDRIYIDLKNIDFLNLNQLHLQIVDKDEVPVDDLVGETIITLHFRHKSDRY